MATLAALLTGCWLVPGQGPARNAFNPLEDELTASNAASLSLAWSVTVDAGATTITDPATLDPVVSPRGVHAVSGNILATYHAATGALRWSVTRFDDANAPFPVQFLGPASVSGESVYSPLQSYRGFFLEGTHAFDATTGAPQGQVAAATASVAVPSGSKIVTTRTENISGDLPVNVLDVTDRADPAQSWNTVFGVGDQLNPTSAAVGSGRLAFATGSTVRVYSLARPAGCAEPVPGIFVCPPLWTRTLDGTATQPVLSADGATAYVGTAAGTLYALDMADGTTRWTGDVGGTRAVTAAVAVGAGHVYTPTDDGRVYVFPDGCGAPTCGRDWRYSTASPIGVQPALAGGVLYTGSDDGSVDAFPAAGCGAPNCGPLKSLETGSDITGAPAVAWGRLHVGTADGRLITYTPG